MKSTTTAAALTFSIFLGCGNADGPTQSNDGTLDLQENDLGAQLECRKGAPALSVVVDCDKVVVRTCKGVKGAVLEYADGRTVWREGWSRKSVAWPKRGQLKGVWCNVEDGPKGGDPRGQHYDVPPIECGDGGSIDAGAGCVPGAACDGGASAACDYNDPRKTYVAQSLTACAAIRFFCLPNQTAFSNACGCGCEGSCSADGGAKGR